MLRQAEGGRRQGKTAPQHTGRMFPARARGTSGLSQSARAPFTIRRVLDADCDNAEPNGSCRGFAWHGEGEGGAVPEKRSRYRGRVAGGSASAGGDAAA